MQCDGGAVFDARHVVLIFLASARPLGVPRVIIQWRARHPSSLGGHFTLCSIGLTPHWLSASRRQLTAEPPSYTSSTMQVWWVILCAWRIDVSYARVFYYGIPVCQLSSTEAGDIEGLLCHANVRHNYFLAP